MLGRSVLKFFSFVLFFSILLSFQSKAQFTLRINMKEAKDSIVHFRSCIFDDKNYIPKDTLKLKKNSFYFNNKKSIFGGIYYLNFPKTKQKIYVALSDKDTLRLQIAGSDYLKTTHSTDPTNELFLEYQRLEKSFSIIDSLYDVEIKRGRKFSHANKAAFFREKTESLVAFRKQALKKIKGSDPLYLYFMTLNRLDESVPNRKNYKGRMEFLQQTAWNDNQLFFSPLYKSLLQEYINYFPLEGDSIYVGVKNVLKSIDCKSKAYPFVVDHFGKLLQNRNISNNVDSYLSFVKNYIQKDVCKVLSETTKKTYLKDVENLSKLKMDQPIIDMKLLDTAKVVVSVLDFAKNYDYTVLAFYDPDCDHCQKELPQMDSTLKVLELRHKLKIGRYYIKNTTFASKARWREFISEYKLTSNAAHVTLPSEGNLQSIFDAFSNPMFHLINRKGELKAKNISEISIRKFFNLPQNNF